MHDELKLKRSPKKFTIVTDLRLSFFVLMNYGRRRPGIEARLTLTGPPEKLYGPRYFMVSLSHYDQIINVIYHI